MVLFKYRESHYYHIKYFHCDEHITRVMTRRNKESTTTAKNLTTRHNKYTIGTIIILTLHRGAMRIF